MRQKNETATSFKELKEITQIMQMQKTSVQTNANADASEIAQKSVLTPKARTHAKNHALKPTKKAFSERQNTAFRDNSQANDKKGLKTAQGNNSSLRADQSDEAIQHGLKTNQENQKRGLQ
ncbi:hypothetical protein ACLGBK_01285 [Helicobacter pylori]